MAVGKAKGNGDGARMDPFMMLLPPVRDLSSTILFCCRIGWDGVNSCQDLEQILPFFHALGFS
jgi:hypothetical protein